MAVVRSKKNKNYTKMSNYHLKDKNLSLKAKGLLSIMLSLPDKWEYSIAGLEVLSNDGKHTTNSAIKELEKHGYLLRKIERNDKGVIVGNSYTIVENPLNNPFTDYPLTDNPVTEKPLTDNPPTEKPLTENQPQLITKESITKELITKEYKKECKKEKKVGTKESYQTIIDGYTINQDMKDAIWEFVKMRKMIKHPLTDKALQLMLSKLSKLADTESERIKIIEQSIEHSWQGLFPLKEEKQQNLKKGFNFYD